MSTSAARGLARFVLDLALQLAYAAMTNGVRLTPESMRDVAGLEMI